MALPRKLHKLKEWLSVPDAAQHLSSIQGEAVSEADLLVYALEGKLKLSINFMNIAFVQWGTLIPYEDMKWEEFRELNGQVSSRPVKSSLVDEKQALKFVGGIEHINNVWDLPMIGSEKLYVTHEYLRKIKGGPSTTLKNINGPLVEGPGGRFGQIRHISSSGLFADSLLVVRTSALIDLVERLKKEHGLIVGGIQDERPPEPPKKPEELIRELLAVREDQDVIAARLSIECGSKDWQIVKLLDISSHLENPKSRNRAANRAVKKGKKILAKRKEEKV